MTVIRSIFFFVLEFPSFVKNIFKCLPLKYPEVEFFYIDYPGEFKDSYLTIKFRVRNFIFIRFPDTTPKFKSGEVVLNSQFIEFPYIVTIQGLFKNKRIIIQKKQAYFAINMKTIPSISMKEVDLRSCEISTNINYKLSHQNIKYNSDQGIKINTPNIKINLPTYERE